MELKEGMYVRTKEGEISKIKWITSQRWEGLENTIEASFMLENNESLEYPRDNFKSSFNIIDLIEEGDYVNGKKVDKICFLEDTYYIKTKVSNTGNYDYLPEHLIEDIVTKEQMEAIKYVIE